MTFKNNGFKLSSAQNEICELDSYLSLSKKRKKKIMFVLFSGSGSSTDKLNIVYDIFKR
jgi:hypothetical protein